MTHYLVHASFKYFPSPSYCRYYNILKSISFYIARVCMMACCGIERQGFDSNMRQVFSSHYNRLTKLWSSTNFMSSV